MLIGFGVASTIRFKLLIKIAFYWFEIRVIHRSFRELASKTQTNTFCTVIRSTFFCNSHCCPWASWHYIVCADFYAHWLYLSLCTTTNERDSIRKVCPFQTFFWLWCVVFFYFRFSHAFYLIWYREYVYCWAPSLWRQKKPTMSSIARRSAPKISNFKLDLLLYCDIIEIQSNGLFCLCVVWHHRFTSKYEQVANTARYIGTIFVNTYFIQNTFLQWHFISLQLEHIHCYFAICVVFMLNMVLIVRNSNAYALANFAGQKMFRIFWEGRGGDVKHQFHYITERRNVYVN